MTAALPADAVLFGFSADAVAVAVRRALSKATGWADHQWEVHPAVGPATHVNVALDEVLTGAGRGRAAATPPCASGSGKSRQS